MAKNWTEKEEQYLKDHFEKKNNAELAEKFGVTAKSIESKLGRLKLRRAKPAKPTKTAKEVKVAKPAAPKVKKQRPTRNVIHDNVRCRYCLIVD
jgi:Zn-dependent peptidase ImmA (M78 family)